MLGRQLAGVSGKIVEPDYFNEAVTIAVECWRSRLFTSVNLAVSNTVALKISLVESALIVSALLGVALPAHAMHRTTSVDIAELEAAKSAAAKGEYTECYNGVCHVANRGHAQAETLLGQIYEKGIGVEKNLGKAAQLYEKGAQKNIREAQYHLGLMFMHGEGVAKNPKRAIVLLKRAANQDLGEAQYHLGKIYMHGEGTPVNLALANQWLHRAAANGVREATVAIDSLPPVQPITGGTAAGRSYQEGMGNLEQSWQGYADLSKTLGSIDSSVSGNTGNN
jgi:hypothetical protein